MAAPRRSRLLASLTTSVALLYLAALSPTTALDTDLSNAPNALLDDLILDGADDGRSRRLDPSYESAFTIFGSGGLEDRASDDLHVLGNNAPEKFTLKRGSTAYFALSLDGMKRREAAATSPNRPLQRDAAEQKERTLGAEGNASRDGLLRRQEEPPGVFVSANICRYPERVAGAPLESAPPKLRLVVSSDGSDERPDSTKPTTETEVFYEGAAMRRINTSTPAVYFGIESPNLTDDDYVGEWALEVAVSTNDWYHSFEEDESPGMLRTVGMDSGTALLSTKSLTENIEEAQAVMDSGPPYTLFVYNANSPHLRRVRRSHCGLEHYAEIASTRDERPSRRLVTSMTTRGFSKLPRQQFRIEGLDATTAYTAILVRTGQYSLTKRQDDDSGSGGVRTFPETQFKTTTGDNCKVISGLDFCSDVEYSVPANEERFNTTALGRKYDDYARTMYANFEKALQQIPCEAPVTSRYSLARTCDDCKDAYKNWLCTVAMPRCDDFFASNNPNALERNLKQAFPNGTSLDDSLVNKLMSDKGPAVMASRSDWIDEEIAPGPYKEVLPCDDVCYQLVQSCPATLEFSCPLPDGDDGMFSMSYATRGGDGSCNALRSPFENTGASLAARGVIFTTLVGVGMALL